MLLSPIDAPGPRISSSAFLAPNSSTSNTLMRPDTNTRTLSAGSELTPTTREPALKTSDFIEVSSLAVNLSLSLPCRGMQFQKGILAKSPWFMMRARLRLRAGGSDSITDWLCLLFFSSTTWTRIHLVICSSTARGTFCSERKLEMDSTTSSTSRPLALDVAYSSCTSPKSRPRKPQPTKMRTMLKIRSPTFSGLMLPRPTVETTERTK
mmetsp:Transcript_63374/g.169468  ORF Transcript_63374/g.169468 Transcript_63374/m.169468 type:complete len:209 (+) Transcript_63374:334-960(+)